MDVDTHTRRRAAARRIERWYHARSHRIQFRVLHREFRATGLVVARTVARHWCSLNTLLYVYPEFAPAIDVAFWARNTAVITRLWVDVLSAPPFAFIARVDETILREIETRPHYRRDRAIAAICVNANNNFDTLTRIFAPFSASIRYTISRTRCFTTTDLARYIDALDRDALRANPHYRPVWERYITPGVTAEYIASLGDTRKRARHVYLYPGNYIDTINVTRVFPNRMRPGYCVIEHNVTFQAAYIQYVWRTRRRGRVARELCKLYPEGIADVIVAYAAELDTNRI